MSKLEKLFNRIEKENEVFKKLSKAEKRVVIAQDCIIRLESKQFIVKAGALIRGGLFKEEESQDLSLKNVLNTNSVVECQVCAKGGLFLSVVGRTNRVQVWQVENENEIFSFEHKTLLKIFSAKQLALIETAFECRQFLTRDEKGEVIRFKETTVNNLYNFWKRNHIYYDDEFERVQNLAFLSKTDLIYKEGYDEDKLLINICKNIIKNKGTFIP